MGLQNSEILDGRHTLPKSTKLFIQEKNYVLRNPRLRIPLNSHGRVLRLDGWCLECGRVVLLALHRAGTVWIEEGSIIDLQEDSNGGSNLSQAFVCTYPRLHIEAIGEGPCAEDDTAGSVRAQVDEDALNAVLMKVPVMSCRWYSDLGSKLRHS